MSSQIKIEELYNNAELYEAENACVQRDLDYWKQIISSMAHPVVLELGCGTGRVARAILDQVDHYVGIDLSAPFLHYFRQSDCFRRYHNKITLEEESVFRYQSDLRFDLIMLTSQFPGHIYDSMEFYLLLSKLKNMLKPRGIIAIDYCNPDIRFLENHTDYQYCYKFPYIGMVQVFEKNTYLQNEQINYEYRKYLFANQTELLQTIPFRIYFPQELDSLIKLSGLRIAEKYGEYDFSEFKEYCTKQLYLLSPVS